MQRNINLTVKEVVAMEILWKNCPLSASEIVENSDVVWAEKTIFAALRSLQNMGMVYVESTRKPQGQRKIIQLYAPSITKAEYFLQLLTSDSIYNENILPMMFQGLIRGSLQQETVDAIHEIIHQEKGDGDWK